MNKHTIPSLLQTLLLIPQQITDASLFAKYLCMWKFSVGRHIKGRISLLKAKGLFILLYFFLNFVINKIRKQPFNTKTVS